MTDWKSLPFMECLEKVKPPNKVKRRDFLKSGSFPVVSQERRLINGYWNNEEDVFRVGNPVVIFGDHTQVVKFIDFDFVVGADGVKILKTKDFLDAKYLYYFIIGNPLNALGYARHFRLLKGLNVTFPSIFEQKRIVAILDETFSGIGTAIANTEKNLANARELFESYLNISFSHHAKARKQQALSELCSITSNLVDPRGQEYFDLPHIGAGNIVSFTGDLIEIQTARNEGLKSGKFIFDSSMVLYSKIRPYLMKVARPAFEGLCSADIYPLKPDPDVLDRDFLYYMLLSKDFTSYAIQGSARAGMPKVNRNHLFAYRVSSPSIGEQKEIAKNLDSMALECRRLEANFEEKIMSLAELKQSLLQKAFSGDLAAELAGDASIEALA